VYGVSRSTTSQTKAAVKLQQVLVIVGRQNRAGLHYL